MPRYQTDIQVYTELAEGNVVAATAAAAGGAPCPTGTSTSNTPNKLAFCTQTGKLVVQVQDGGGSAVTGATTSIGISSVPAGITGATTVAAVNGVATFDQLYLNIPGTYRLTARAADLPPVTSDSFTVAINLERARYFRNKIVDKFMGDIDHVYGEYTDALYTGKGFQAVEGDIVNLGLTAASTISVVTRTKTILAALATGATGVNLSFDKNFFGQQTFAALAIAMQARRDQARRSITGNEQLSVTDYTLDAARRELISYFYSGTLPGAIQEIQEEAATKSAKETTNEAAGSVAKLAFTQTQNGRVGTPLSVQVQVEDSNGKVVTSATNSITITSSPAGVTGTLTASAVAGVATFNLSFPVAGPFTLTAKAAGLTDATSDPISIVAAGALIPLTAPEPPAAPPPAPPPAPPRAIPRATEGLH